MDSSLNMNHQVANGRKVAYFMPSKSVLRFANEWNENFRKNTAAEKRCYIGEELCLPEAIYHVATSIEGERLAEICATIIKAGIRNRLIQEYDNIRTFRKVQDRSRIISQTKLVEEVDEVRSLKLSHGKLTNVFRLWAICLACCVAEFAVEYLCYFYGSISRFC